MIAMIVPSATPITRPIAARGQHVEEELRPPLGAGHSPTLRRGSGPAPDAPAKIILEDEARSSRPDYCGSHFARSVSASGSPFSMR